MANPYDVSTVVSRSYIPEQYQDQLQKGAHERSVQFLQEFQKEAEKRGKNVEKVQDSNNPSVSEHLVKPADKDSQKEKRGKKQRKDNEHDVAKDDGTAAPDKSHLIDIKA